MARDRLPSLFAAGVGILALSALARPLSAQNPTQILDSLRRAYQVPLLPATEVAATASRLAPAQAMSSQSAFGASYGDGFVGAGFASHTRTRDQSDGSLIGGLGFFNARDNVGVEPAIYLFSTFREGFGQRGAFGLKVHHVWPMAFATAIGAENIGNWGGTDAPHTYYAVGSKVWRLRERQGDPFGSVTTNLGVGDGRFSPKEDSLGNVIGSAWGVFGSASLRVFEPLSLIADWGGQDLALAASIVPLRWVPLVITPGIADVLQRHNHKVAFVIGAGFGFKYDQFRNIFIPRR
jgi:hypothetical protein